MANGSTRTLVRVGMTTLALTLAACGGGGGSSDGTEAPAPATAALSQAANCEDLLGAIRADAREKIRVQAEELRARGWTYGNGQPIPTAAAFPTPAATAAPGDLPPDFSDTNTQVPGVDEADIVETDGTRLYLAHHGSTGDELLLVRAVPPEATAIEERIAIEGFTLGMFVADGRALVASSVYDDGTLGGDSRCELIGLPFPTAGFDSAIGGWRPPDAICQATFTKLTLLDVSASPARIVREIYVEGHYLAARRHENRARLLVQRSWGAPVGVGDPWERIWSPRPPADVAELRARVDAWETEALATIESSTLADWLPTMRERVGGTLVDGPLACDRTHLPPPGHARHGVTVLVGLDLVRHDAAPEVTTLLGSGDQVYANEDTLVLAYPEWHAVPFGEAATRTALHVFGLPPDSLTTVYRGSGFVPGSVLSQFAIDARGDVLRVATSYARLDGRTVSRVATMRLADNELVALGATPDLAPGEQLRGARFLGDTAYLVTFEQIDPLFVVDLADPVNPRVLGEVDLPGFSTYLHPLDATHLLTLGRAGDAEGRLRGLALRIFDVGDTAAPRLTAEYELATHQGSPAEYDHLAFTYDARLGLLALPTNDEGLDNTAHLHVFAIDAEAGIALRGSVSRGGGSLDPCPPPFMDMICGHPGLEAMQRGVFVDDAVYSVGRTQLQVHALSDLSTPLATIELR